MIFIDYETRSMVDVRDVGSSYYAKHPSTSILCLAVARDDKPAELWTDFSKCPYTESDFIVAHNAGFEKAITEYLLPHWPKTKKWIDTASMCSMAGLPRGLKDVAILLGLKNKKDAKGNALIDKLSKPRKPTKKNPEIWDNDACLLDLMYKYCKQDVEVTRELYHALPKFTKSEYGIWWLNREMNERGLRVNKDAIESAMRVIDSEQKKAEAELKIISLGTITRATQTGRIREFCDVDTLSVETLGEKIKAAEGVQRRVLEIRRDFGPSSVAKLKAIKSRLCDDSRVRDMLIHYGAMTGRETGAGPQPLNMPRGKIKSESEYIECIDLITRQDVKALCDRYGSVLRAISYALRGMFIPESGKKFICSDLNAIEARLVFWIANEILALDFYREGKDIYRQMASRIYGISESDIKKDSDERFVGKTAILGLGYGMGKVKFQETCKKYGVEVSDKLAKQAVYMYRNTFKGVPKLWDRLNNDAKRCIVTRRETGIYQMRDKWLLAELPSGRFLYYFEPEFSASEGITYWGRDKDKKYTRLHTFGGKLLENIVQATSRDLLWDIIRRLKKVGYTAVLSVYDEILCEQERGSLEEMNSIMIQTPEFLSGLPLAADGWEGYFYRKG